MTIRMPAPLLAVDAPSLMYRAFFALPDSIKDAEGRPANALLGTANLVLWVVERHAPRAVVMCFGAEAAHYRTELFAPYHADRPTMPGGLATQWADAPALFDAFGWTVLIHDTLEADDLLGTLAQRETEAGGETLLFTGDRDMFQCVERHRDACCSPRRRGQGRAGGHRAGRGARPLRHRPGAGARLHRAARRSRPTACPARRASARRPPATCCARTGRSRASSRPPRKPGTLTPASPARCSSRPTSCAGSARSRRCRPSRTWSARPTGRPTSPAPQAARASTG